MIWDGDCSFCRRWITRWEHRTGGKIDYEPSQTAADRFPQIPREEFSRSVFLIEPDGKITRAAEAVFRSLALASCSRYLLWMYQRVPGFAAMTEAAYRFIARHRNPIDRLDRIIVGTESRPATYVLTRGLFLRSIGVVYLIAFLSAYAQIDGLIGSNGILPVRSFVDYVTQRVGNAKWYLAPTLLYHNPSDATLHGLCIAGIVSAILLIVGVVPMFTTFVLWACYLSLVTAGQIFLGYQWDALLLEAGFLAILFSPPRWAGSRGRPSRVVLFLIRWLLFRLMLLSAIVKWFSGDGCWRDMTALRFHFETQPIPAWTSWYAHHWPHWMLAVGCLLMFIVEAIVPFLYFAPRRARMLAFWLTLWLQLAIMATGNYGFFNLLAIVLAFSLLDDSAIARLFRRKPPALPLPPGRPILRPIAVWPLAVVTFIVSGMAAIDRVALRRIDWPIPLAKLQAYVAPFDSTNAYGLFAVMTKDRPELVIEGSNDGVNWKPYEFKWKAGDPMHPPRYCIPHMPRLDWQLWFAALDPARNANWIQSFAYRLLVAQPEVLKLIDHNPFPDHPPKSIRIVLYDYHFSTPAERAATGVWWTRDNPRLYLPPVSLRGPKQSSEPFSL